VLLHLWERRSLPSGAVANGSVHELLVTGTRLQVVCSDADAAGVDDLAEEEPA
jgi:uncharacterized phosphatase